jgi:hypothetical protein
MEVWRPLVGWTALSTSLITSFFTVCAANEVRHAHIDLISVYASAKEQFSCGV